MPDDTVCLSHTWLQETPLIPKEHHGFFASSHPDFKAAFYTQLRGLGYPPLTAACAILPKMSTVKERAKGEAIISKYEAMPEVQNAVKKFQAMLGLTREDVIAGMLDAVHASQTAMELVVAWREIGRLIGAYNAPLIEQTPSTSGLLKQLSTMTDADLLKIAEPVLSEYITPTTVIRDDPQSAHACIDVTPERVPGVVDSQGAGVAGAGSA